MRVDVLGHASLLVHGREGSVLFDPLFDGVHHEGLYDVHPRRELDLARMPRFDAVVLSHVHADHFDAATVRRLPREVPVVVPRDPLMVECLERLGFERVHPVQAFDEVEIGSLRIVPTPAPPEVVEHGFVVVDGDEVLWNLVDTAPLPAQIAAVRKRHPRVDLAVVPWQPLQDTDWTRGRGTRFPFGMYGALLGNALDVDARHVVPGSCGFRAIGPAAWTNQLLFPVTRPRFVHDLLAARPSWQGKVHCVDPGDRLLVSGGEVCKEAGALPWCRSEPHDPFELAFRPHIMGFEPVERRAEFSRARCRGLVARFLEETVPRHVAANAALYVAHARWGVRHQVEVVFADGTEWWVLDHSGAGFATQPGRDPLALTHSTVLAGALCGLLRDALSWSYVAMSGEYRYVDHTYAVDARGLHEPSSVPLVDVLATLLFGRRNEARCLRRRIGLEETTHVAG